LRENRYIYRAWVSEAKVCELLRPFAADLGAYQIAEPASLNRDTVNLSS